VVTLAARPAPRFVQTADTPIEAAIARYAATDRRAPDRLTPHLRRLENEAIEIMREVVAAFRNPVLMYSIGKDSTVMMHVARKAFHPAPPPFPFLHIATTWDFGDMIRYRDALVAALGIELRVHTNEDGLRRGINPIASGAGVHAQVMSTEGLKQALDKWRFDAAFGGGRRDEEKSRAKERIFSFRTPLHAWDPRRQRPELWNLFNTRINEGESIRVFPLSNWTEADIWSYIALEEIPVVPLYFAKPRPVVRRQGALILVDDERLPVEPGEAETMMVRFRTLGCYPLTAATQSEAADIDAVLAEMRASRKSEREGRLIDHDEAASMERKKREGYF
jgi:sulfate adenylyltransferase subunit 2